MTNPDHPPAGQPGTPGQAWAPPQQGAPAAEPEKKGAKKWLPVAGGVAVAGVVGLGSLTGWFGIGDPKVGDCVLTTGATSFEVVDCSSEEAEFKIVGVEKDQQTYPDFEEDLEVCEDFATAEIALWTGEVESEGTVTCAAAI
jgi:hypothetical protein